MPSRTFSKPGPRVDAFHVLLQLILITAQGFGSIIVPV